MNLTTTTTINKVKIITQPTLQELEEEINEYLRNGYLQSDTRHLVDDVKIITEDRTTIDNMGYNPSTNKTTYYIALLIGRRLENKQIIQTN